MKKQIVWTKKFLGTNCRVSIKVDDFDNRHCVVQKRKYGVWVSIDDADLAARVLSECVSDITKEV